MSGGRKISRAARGHFAYCAASMIDFIRQIWIWVKPYRVRLFLGVLMGVLCGLIEPLMILTVTFVFNVIFPSAGADQVTIRAAWLPEQFKNSVNAAVQSVTSGARTHQSGVVLLVGLIPLIILLRGLFTYLNVYYLQWASIRAITDLRVRLFSHLLNLSASFLSKNNSGELMSRVVSDTGQLQGVISNTLSVVVKDPVTLVCLLAYLLWAQPKLTLISLVAVPVCVVPIVIYSRKVRHSSAAIQGYFAELATLMIEAFTGSRIIKAYNLEGTVVRRFSDTAQKFIGQYLRVIRATETPGPLLEFFGAVGVSLVFLYLVFQTGPRPNSADFLGVILAIFSMYRPMKMVTRLHSQLEQARASSERVFQLLKETTTVPDPVQPKPLHAAGAAIHFDNVSFDYGEKPVLRDIQLTVQPGQLVALVGATGSGKTTLTNLLLRFYDPVTGAVRIGGTDLRDVAQRDLRDHIAVVTQETILFNDTIRNNIALGRPDASEAEIIAAAQHARAYDFIKEKERGFDTIIGEKGVMLSGGQRQRLAIARAIVKNAPILILDEATSALDAETERAFQESLDELMVGRTTICIAHRFSTIQHADVIVVLDQGRIVETGRHEELLARNGIYQKLHALQFQS